MKKFFPTEKRESFRSALSRRGFNFFPAYRRTGGRLVFISGDWQEIHVRLSLNWATRNYVGTVFGGSIYGSVDPIYMMQFIKILGPDYVVWDKGATVRFLKPIRNTVYARCLVTNAQVEEARSKVRSDHKCTLELATQFQDALGTVYAEVTKLVYIADKAYYKARPLFLRS